MAASTAGTMTLRGAQSGRTRVEAFTMTPSNGQFVTFASNGQGFITINAEGEYITDILLNGDGTTTCSQGKFYVDGQDIRVRFLLTNLISTTPVTRLSSTIGIHGGAQLQFQMLT